MNADERQELIDMLIEAQEQLSAAAEAIRYVAREMDNGEYWVRYLVSGIEIAASSESVWVSRDPSIDTMIEALEEMEESDPDELASDEVWDRYGDPDSYI